MEIVTIVIWVVICYALGCVTAGYYWVRIRTSRDLREEGSCSVGARNAGRLIGPSGFVIVLLWDFLKGVLAVSGARYLNLGEFAVAASILAVVSGHIWPAQLGFRGGKGIATSLGALLVLNPIIIGLQALVCIPIYAISRSLTLGGLAAFAISPTLFWIFGMGFLEIITGVLLAGIVLYTHWENLSHRLKGLFAR